MFVSFQFPKYLLPQLTGTSASNSVSHRFCYFYQIFSALSLAIIAIFASPYCGLYFNKNQFYWGYVDNKGHPWTTTVRDIEFKATGFLPLATFIAYVLIVGLLKWVNAFLMNTSIQVICILAKGAIGQESEERNTGQREAPPVECPRKAHSFAGSINKWPIWYVDSPHHLFSRVHNSCCWVCWCCAATSCHPMPPWTWLPCSMLARYFPWDSKRKWNMKPFTTDCCVRH